MGLTDEARAARELYRREGIAPLPTDEARATALSKYADLWRRAYWAHREVPGRHRDECCQDECWPDIAERVVNELAPSILQEIESEARAGEPRPYKSGPRGFAWME